MKNNVKGAKVKKIIVKYNSLNQFCALKERNVEEKF